MSEVIFYEGDLSRHAPEMYLPLLSTFERERSDFYLFSEERNRFVVRRGIVRTLLGIYLGKNPTEIRIWLGPWGKPEAEGVHFNTSYSGNKMVVALSKNGPLGVDLEERGGTNWSEEAESLLYSCQEKIYAANLLSEERKDYFLSIWTKKEAWLKGIGCGLIADPRAFDTEAKASNWRFTSLAVEGTHIAFLATTEEVSLCKPL